MLVLAVATKRVPTVAARRSWTDSIAGTTESDQKVEPAPVPVLVVADPVADVGAGGGLGTAVEGDTEVELPVDVAVGSDVDARNSTST